MIVVFLGPPGSGKGTQADILADHHGYFHFDTGARLRAEIASGSELGVRIASFTDKGNLVPISIIRELIITFLRSSKETNVLFDGFPRNLDQAQVLDEGLDELGIDLDLALYLEINEDSLTDRIVNRWFCPECGEIYNVHTRPPAHRGICDTDGAKLYQRKDDTAEVFKHRLNVYMDQTVPVLEYYRKQNRLVTIDGDRNISEVAEAIRMALGAARHDQA